MSKQKPRLPKTDHLDDLGPLTAIDQAMLAVASEELTVVENGKTKSIRKDHLLAKSAYKDALSGSSHARGQALRTTLHAQIKQARDIEKKTELAKQLKQVQQLLLDDALEADEPTRLILPHPDDIVIDQDCGYRLIGPFDEQSLLKMEREIKERDVLILQAEFEDRLDWDEEPDRDPTIPKEIGNGSALLLANLTNQTLPERHRLSDSEWVWATWKHQRKTKRDLLKEARKAWRSIGQPKPRGWTTPPIGQMYRLLRTLTPCVQALKASIDDRDADAQKEAEVDIQAEIRQFRARQIEIGCA